MQYFLSALFTGFFILLFHFEFSTRGTKCCYEKQSTKLGKRHFISTNKFTLSNLVQADLHFFVVFINTQMLWFSWEKSMLVKSSVTEKLIMHMKAPFTMRKKWCHKFKLFKHYKKWMLLMFVVVVRFCCSSCLASLKMADLINPMRHFLLHWNIGGEGDFFKCFIFWEFSFVDNSDKNADGQLVD